MVRTRSGELQPGDSRATDMLKTIKAQSPFPDIIPYGSVNVAFALGPFKRLPDSKGKPRRAEFIKQNRQVSKFRMSRRTLLFDEKLTLSVI